MEDEAMWERWWRWRRPKDRDRIARIHMHLVDETIWRFPRPSTERAVGQGDLHMAGYLGLIECIERWDPALGHFKPYASRRIWGAMQDELRAWDWVPRTARAAIRAGQEVPGKAQSPLSLDAALDDEVDVPLLDLLLAPEDVFSIDLDPAMSALAMLKEAKPRLFTVVSMFAAGFTGPEIAKEFGVTESRISQLRSEARRLLVEYGWEAAAA